MEIRELQRSFYDRNIWTRGADFENEVKAQHLAPVA